MKLKTITSILLTLSVASCTLIDFEDPQVSPPTSDEKGKVTLVTDWTIRSSNIEKPSYYKVIINKQNLSYTQDTNQLPRLNSGKYPVVIYNTADKIEVNGTTASVTTDNNTVDAYPGFLFTAVTSAVYNNSVEDTLIAVMEQQIRQLTIELTVIGADTERITSTLAKLGGIAQSLNFETNVYQGRGLSINPVFKQDKEKLKATVHLLGKSDELQVLHLELTLKDGNTYKIDSDISNLLGDFNNNKHIPITISANLNIPTKPELNATITQWKSTNASGGIAQ